MKNFLFILSVVFCLKAHAEYNKLIKALISVGVDQVDVPKKVKGPSLEVKFSGQFPNSCYKYKEAKLITNKARHFELQVLAEMSSGMCLMVMTPFSGSVVIDGLKPGRHTLSWLESESAKTRQKRQFLVLK